jgi:hypothetical protein
MQCAGHLFCVGCDLLCYIFDILTTCESTLHHVRMCCCESAKLYATCKWQSHVARYLTSKSTMCKKGVLLQYCHLCKIDFRHTSLEFQGLYDSTRNRKRQRRIDNNDAPSLACYLYIIRLSDVLVSISIEHHHLTVAVCKIMERSLKCTNSLTTLMLNHNSLTKISADCIGDAITRSCETTKLRVLHLNMNVLDQGGNFSRLLRGLHRNDTLRTLQMHGKSGVYNKRLRDTTRSLSFTSDVHVLLQTSSSLMELSISYNYIEINGIKVLMRGLRHNHTIVSVALRYCDIGNSAALELVSALERMYLHDNKTSPRETSALKSLDLRHNRIGLGVSKAIERFSSFVDIDINDQAPCQDMLDCTVLHFGVQHPVQKCTSDDNTNSFRMQQKHCQDVSYY